MRKRDKLYRLIKTLGKAEKKHFMLYANAFIKKEKNSYVLLFQYIAKHKIESDEELLAIAPPNTFKNLTGIKTYLYKKILDSLIIANQHAQSELYLELLKAQCLHQKGLSEDALIILKNLEAKVDTATYSYTHLDNYLIQLNIHASNPHTSTFYDELGSLLNKIQSFLEIQTLENQYKLLNIEAVAKTRNLNIKKEQSHSNLIDMLQHPLLKDTSHLKNDACHYLYYHTKFLVFNSLNDTENMFQIAKKHFELVFKNETLITRNILLGWGNLLNACISKNDVGCFQQYIHLLNPIVPQDNTQKGYYVYVKNWALLNLCTKLKLTDLFEKEFSIDIVHLETSPHYQKLLYVELASYYFHVKEFSKSLDIINKVSPKLEPKTNTELSFSLLFFLNHLELKNYILCYNLINNFQKKLKTHKPDAIIFHKILNTLKRLNKKLNAPLSSPSTIISIYQKLIELVDAETIYAYSNMYQYNYFKNWINEKIALSEN